MGLARKCYFWANSMLLHFCCVQFWHCCQYSNLRPNHILYCSSFWATEWTDRRMNKRGACRPSFRWTPFTSFPPGRLVAIETGLRLMQCDARLLEEDVVWFAVIKKKTLLPLHHSGKKKKMRVRTTCNSSRKHRVEIDDLQSGQKVTK